MSRNQVRDFINREYGPVGRENQPTPSDGVGGGNQFEALLPRPTPVHITPAPQGLPAARQITAADVYAALHASQQQKHESQRACYTVNPTIEAAADFQFDGNLNLFLVAHLLNEASK